MVGPFPTPGRRAGQQQLDCQAHQQWCLPRSISGILFPLISGNLWAITSHDAQRGAGFHDSEIESHALPMILHFKESLLLLVSAL